MTSSKKKQGSAKVQSDLRMRRMTSRMVWTLSATIWLFVCLGIRLFQVQVVQAGRYREIAHLEHFQRIAIPALRGSITDRNGALLAVSTTGQSVAAFPGGIPDKKETAEKLSSILRIPVSELFPAINTTTPFVWIDRKISDDKAKELLRANLPGIELVKESSGKRVYPKGSLVCSVLGYTGVDDQGLDGIELSYDSKLRGTSGYILEETDGLGRVLPSGVVKRFPSTSGDNLTLTIDETIQYIAERELRKAAQTYHAKRASILVMDPKNGEILALANYPAFDGNRYSRYPAGIRRDSAISDDYEPGSTFKAILAAAALNSGQLRPEEKFLSSPSLRVDGWTIGNADDGLQTDSPNQSMETIIADSLNVGAASIGLKIGQSPLLQMMERLGFYRRTGIDLPGEAAGEIPSAPWQKIQLATISFGQGLAVTPIQLLRGYAAFANGGYLVRPHLVKRITSPQGSVTEFREKPVPVLSSRVAEQVKSLLSLVVTKGTGTQAAISGYTVAGKTGTAQIAEGGKYLSGSYVASFLGFVPLENPSLVILVKVDDPTPIHWGGSVSAPVFRKVAQEALWHLDIPPSSGMVQSGSWKLFPVGGGKTRE